MCVGLLLLILRPINWHVCCSVCCSNTSSARFIIPSATADLAVQFRGQALMCSVWLLGPARLLISARSSPCPGLVLAACLPARLANQQGLVRLCAAGARLVAGPHCRGIVGGGQHQAHQCSTTPPGRTRWCLSLAFVICLYKDQQNGSNVLEVARCCCSDSRFWPAREPCSPPA